MGTLTTCRGLPQVADAAEKRTFRAGEAIYREGEKQSWLGLIEAHCSAPRASAFELWSWVVRGSAIVRTSSTGFRHPSNRSIAYAHPAGRAHRSLPTAQKPSFAKRACSVVRRAHFRFGTQSRARQKESTLTRFGTADMSSMRSTTLLGASAFFASCAASSRRDTRSFRLSGRTTSSSILVAHAFSTAPMQVVLYGALHPAVVLPQARLQHSVYAIARQARIAPHHPPLPPLPPPGFLASPPLFLSRHHFLRRSGRLAERAQDGAPTSAWDAASSCRRDAGHVARMLVSHPDKWLASMTVVRSCVRAVSPLSIDQAPRRIWVRVMHSRRKGECRPALVCRGFQRRGAPRRRGLRMSASVSGALHKNRCVDITMYVARRLGTLRSLSRKMSRLNSILPAEVRSRSGATGSPWTHGYDLSVHPSLPLVCLPRRLALCRLASLSLPSCCRFLRVPLPMSLPWLCSLSQGA